MSGPGGYVYANERPKLFTEDGSVLFVKLRDRAIKLLATAGAFTVGHVIEGLSGDTWVMLACVDRLVEMGELWELTDPSRVRGQDRVFVLAGVS